MKLKIQAMELKAKIQELIDSFPLQEIEGEDFKVEAIFHEFVSQIPVEERREAGHIIRELMQERRERIGKKKYTKINLKEQFESIENIVSMSYIAQHYFDKDQVWLNQRIHSDIVNGEPFAFNDGEIEKLRLALCDIRNKLSQIIKNIS